LAIPPTISDFAKSRAMALDANPLHGAMNALGTLRIENRRR
jgi:hypothetical protein